MAYQELAFTNGVSDTYTVTNGEVWIGLRLASPNALGSGHAIVKSLYDGATLRGTAHVFHGKDMSDVILKLPVDTEVEVELVGVADETLITVDVFEA